MGLSWSGGVKFGGLAGGSECEPVRVAPTRAHDASRSVGRLRFAAAPAGRRPARAARICARMQPWISARLLDGLEGEDRAARERLLERLAGEGFTLEELTAAIEEDRLALLLVERVLGGRYTAEELEERTGLRRPRCCGSGGCSDCPSPGRTTACSARRRSTPRSRSACSFSPGSARSRSPRSRGCSARGRGPGAREPRHQAGRARDRRDRAAGAAREDDRRRRDVRQPRRRGARVGRAVVARGGRGRRSAEPPRRRRVGPALQRAGDYYGHAVNLASRVTGVARPGSVLCTQEVRDAVPDRFDWSFARKHKLKGMSEAVSLYRARPLGRGQGERRRLRNRKQIDDEHERRVRRDRRADCPWRRRRGSPE